jgi:hypothetical protein
VGLSAPFQVEGALHFLFNLEEMVNVRGNSLSEEFIVKLATMPLDHILEPFVVMLLVKIGRNPLSKLAPDIEQLVAQDRVPKVFGCLVSKHAVNFKEILHVVLVCRSGELENPNLQIILVKTRKYVDQETDLHDFPNSSNVTLRNGVSKFNPPAEI